MGGTRLCVEYCSWYLAHSDTDIDNTLPPHVRSYLFPLLRTELEQLAHQPQTQRSPRTIQTSIGVQTIGSSDDAAETPFEVTEFSAASATGSTPSSPPTGTTTIATNTSKLVDPSLFGAGLT